MLRPSITLLALTLVLAPAHMRAQAGVADSTGGAAAGVHEQMSGMLMENPHMRMTPLGAPRPGEAERADSIVLALRASIAKYEDYRVALADGYQVFLKGVKQKVYHFTNRERALLAAFEIDASRPTSLLYEKTADGYRLVGAMYTAPKRFTAEQLDARVPLSVAQWHVHVNLCLPPKGEISRWKKTEGGRPKFGPKGVIAEKTACEAEGGRWVPQLFGWMVHVDPFAGDPKVVGGTHRHESRGKAR